MKIKFGILSVIVFTLSLWAGPPRTFTLGWDYSLTPASELSGYVLYSGNSTNTVAPVANLGMTNRVTLNNVANGIYYFAVTCVGTNGVESDFSNFLRVPVPLPPGQLKNL